MIDFDQAIDIATDHATRLVKGAQNLTLESVLISDDDKNYEVTISYLLDGLDINTQRFAGSGALNTLASLMAKRRETKVFIVGKYDGKFKGFKIYKEK